MKREQIGDCALFLLRLVLGMIFLGHGMQKLFGVFGGSGIEGFAGMLNSMGMKPSFFWAWLVALSEGLGGLLLILGVIPRISGALISVIMLVAMVTVHGREGFFGVEFQLLITAVSLYIVMVGSGKFSLYNKL